jgi:hypothetical protein
VKDVVAEVTIHGENVTEKGKRGKGEEGKFSTQYPEAKVQEPESRIQNPGERH